MSVEMPEVGIVQQITEYLHVLVVTHMVAVRQKTLDQSFGHV